MKDDKWLSELEQAECGLERLSQLMATYHKELLSAGIKEQLADELVISYQSLIFNLSLLNQSKNF